MTTVRTVSATTTTGSGCDAAKWSVAAPVVATTATTVANHGRGRMARPWGTATRTGETTTVSTQEIITVAVSICSAGLISAVTTASNTSARDPVSPMLKIAYKHDPWIYPRISSYSNTTVTIFHSVVLHHAWNVGLSNNFSVRSCDNCVVCTQYGSHFQNALVNNNFDN